MIRALGAAAVVAVAASAAAAGRTDLALEGLDAGRLCVGSGNRIEVTLSNLGDGVVEPGVEVVLTVQTPGRAPHRRVERARAMAPGDRLRLTFEGVEVPAPADVLLRAEADPDHRIDDPDRHNNTASVLEPASVECGAGRRSSAGGLRSPIAVKCPVIEPDVASLDSDHRHAGTIQS